MSMLNVAKLAGVSISTVSRVVNDHPCVSVSTVESVRKAMAELNFTPSIRKGALAARRHGSERVTRLAFVVLSPGASLSPGFERLLRGLSDACTQYDVEIGYHFLQNANRLPARIKKGEIDGVLLFGPRPGRAIQQQLEQLPTVWLMANPERPTWGDQVMPDNMRIGEIAAHYLLERGHRRVAYLNSVSQSWGLDVRGLFFALTAREQRAEVLELKAADLDPAPTDARQSIERLVQQMFNAENRPTGLFVLEDCLLAILQNVLDKFGIDYGSGGELELISCNNERQYFMGLRHVPATIDIRTEVIARRGVEQMLWRLEHDNSAERVRFTIEPALVCEEENEQKALSMQSVIN